MQSLLIFTLRHVSVLKSVSDRNSESPKSRRVLLRNRVIGGEKSSTCAPAKGLQFARTSFSTRRTEREIGSIRGRMQGLRYNHRCYKRHNRTDDGSIWEKVKQNFKERTEERKKAKLERENARAEIQHNCPALIKALYNPSYIQSMAESRRHFPFFLTSFASNPCPMKGIH